uniref:Uncharacterized protein n=1 Tax=Piliocolobus tephrosceles TaxID=591936 RepID=A0A8C9H0E6_9PRIM
MSYMLQHLTSGWDVDQAIINEEERLVCIRFGHDYDPDYNKEKQKNKYQIKQIHIH